eukprot:713354-Alexandrium_andersonii.AAC.2
MARATWPRPADEGRPRRYAALSPGLPPELGRRPPDPHPVGRGACAPLLGSARAPWWKGSAVPARFAWL